MEDSSHLPVESLHTSNQVLSVAERKFGNVSLRNDWRSKNEVGDGEQFIERRDEVLLDRVVNAGLGRKGLPSFCFGLFRGKKLFESSRRELDFDDRWLQVF